MTNVIDFPGREEALDTQRFDMMFTEIHVNAPDLDAFVASLGTPDEWLGAAMQHVKVALPSGHSAGTVTVSAAALSLMMMKLEELLYDGPKLALALSEGDA